MITSKEIQLGEFIFITSQFGAEKPIKNDLLQHSDGFRLAFSRPGLLTFKFAAADKDGSSGIGLNRLSSIPSTPLVRLCGYGFGNVRGTNDAERVESALRLAGNNWDAIHVFLRDPCLPGSHDFEPSQRNSMAPIVAQLQSTLNEQSKSPLINGVANLGQRILDIVIVDNQQWFVGWHQANQRHECWPGGAWPLSAPIGMISRAYLKMAEALAWSGLPIVPGDSVVEIGSSPGGACQRLLDLGLRVTGIDAAEMDQRVLDHPRFEHWRGKAATIKRKRYSKFRWLVADANVAPNYTLDVVEDIVAYPGNRIEGMVLTLKLSTWDMLSDVPSCIDRIRSLGFGRVAIKQLASNRRECCLVASRTGAFPNHQNNTQLIETATSLSQDALQSVRS